MPAQIMITGATGFLGSHLLKFIINKTDYNVILLKRSFSNLSKISDLISNKRVKMFNIDENSLGEAFRGG